ncbi:MAG: hypothetical protein GY701_22205 [Sulfitobacter sp.]|nr:hypothetical protein [Sulfitobacter sp.]
MTIGVLEYNPVAGVILGVILLALVVYGIWVYVGAIWVGLSSTFSDLFRRECRAEVVGRTSTSIHVTNYPAQYLAPFDGVLLPHEAGHNGEALFTVSMVGIGHRREAGVELGGFWGPSAGFPYGSEHTTVVLNELDGVEAWLIRHPARRPPPRRVRGPGFGL